MGKTVRPEIRFEYRGNIEVGTGKPGYRWAPGYSQGDGAIVFYPFKTRRECQREAKAAGAVAVFGDGK